MGLAGHADKYKVPVGKSETKTQLKRPRHKWEDNIKMDVKEILWRGEVLKR